MGLFIGHWKNLILLGLVGRREGFVVFNGSFLMTGGISMAWFLSASKTAENGEDRGMEKQKQAVGTKPIDLAFSLLTIQA